MIGYHRLQAEKCTNNDNFRNFYWKVWEKTLTDETASNSPLKTANLTKFQSICFFLSKSDLRLIQFDLNSHEI